MGVTTQAVFDFNDLSDLSGSCSTYAGLPAHMMLVGRHTEDETILGAADAFDGFR